MALQITSASASGETTTRAQRRSGIFNQPASPSTPPGRVWGHPSPNPKEACPVRVACPGSGGAPAPPGRLVVVGSIGVPALALVEGGADAVVVVPVG
ncbi:MAG: hypothetical protein KatS3mg011_0819 [Acidimicrobiia bacterium]|nr:MAG: hypothetical protein KatS3mg011_0819 [Acidimicrobiia bacterium]